MITLATRIDTHVAELVERLQIRVATDLGRSLRVSYAGLPAIARRAGGKLYRLE